MNVSATLKVFSLLRNPSLCLPHATVPTFDRVPISVATALTAANGGQTPDIRAVVLDKDNCFAKPTENSIYGPYKEHFQSLRKIFPDARVLVVSNSAGTLSDYEGKEAKLLEQATGVKVLKHSTKKPGCGLDIFNYLQSIPEIEVNYASQIAVIGDRLLTDVVMASTMGSWSIWIRDGVVENSGLFSRAEKSLPSFLIRRGFKAQIPKESIAAPQSHGKVITTAQGQDAAAAGQWCSLSIDHLEVKWETKAWIKITECKELSEQMLDIGPQRESENEPLEGVEGLMGWEAVRFERFH